MLRASGNLNKFFSYHTSDFASMATQVWVYAKNTLRRSTTSGYDPQAETCVGILARGCRTLPHLAGAPRKLWAEAAVLSSELRNRTERRINDAAVGPLLREMQDNNTASFHLAAKRLIALACGGRSDKIAPVALMACFPISSRARCRTLDNQTIGHTAFPCTLPWKTWFLQFLAWCEASRVERDRCNQTALDPKRLVHALAIELKFCSRFAKQFCVADVCCAQGSVGKEVL